MGNNQKQGADERSEVSTQSTVGLDDDRLYRVLAARPRRRLLYYLNNADRSTATELAEVLVGWERSRQGGMASESEYHRVLTALRHSHLPLLDDAGLVAYNAETGTVECEPLDAEVGTLLTRSIEAETA